MKNHTLRLLAVMIAFPIVGSAEIVIDDFEANAGNWTVKGQGLQLQLTDSPAEVKEGKSAGKLIADYDKPYSSSAKFDLADTSGISPETGSLKFWLFGDGSGAKLQISFIAQDGGVFSIEKAIGWSGWEDVEVPLKKFTFNKFAGPAEGPSQNLDPAQIKTLMIGVYGGLKAGDAKHEFFIDSIRLLP